MIKFRCPHCQQKLGVPDEYAGHRIRCNKCKQPSIVPQAAISPVPGIQTDPPPKVPATESAHSQLTGSVTTTADLTSQYEIAERNEAARQEAIRIADKNRARAAGKQKTTKGDGHAGSNGSRRQKADRLTFQELIPDFLRIPLSIIFGFAATGVVILIWIICSRAAANALCFMAIFVPIAPALVIRVLVVERGFLVGVMCVIIGGLSIAGGKAAITQFVVIPYFETNANEEFLTDLDSILTDPKQQLPSSESIKPFAQDGDFMTCAALVAVVEEGQAEPVKVRSLAVHIMLNSNKLSLIDFFDSVTSGGSSGASAEPIRGLTAEDEAVFEKASMKMSEWFNDETEMQMARKYYPAVARVTQQADILRTFEDGKLTYQLAFMNTLGLFDLVWIFMGLGLGYSVAVFD